jgi:hypothetical protein
MGILIGSNWTSNLEKNQMLLFSHYVAEIEDKRFYDYSPEFIADQKSEVIE